MTAAEKHAALVAEAEAAEHDALMHERAGRHAKAEQCRDAAFAARRRADDLAATVDVETRAEKIAALTEGLLALDAADLVPLLRSVMEARDIVFGDAERVIGEVENETANEGAGDDPAGDSGSAQATEPTPATGPSDVVDAQVPGDQGPGSPAGEPTPEPDGAADGAGDGSAEPAPEAPNVALTRETPADPGVETVADAAPGPEGDDEFAGGAV